MFDDLLLPKLTDHRKDFSNIKPAILIDACEISSLSCERIRCMEKNYGDFRVTFDEALEVTWIRPSKIDTTKQLKKEML